MLTCLHGDVSKVTDFSSMFLQAQAFTSDLSAWNTSSATNMASTFNAAVSFDSGLTAWDVSKVTDFRYMFFLAYAFQQDLCVWGPVIVANNPSAAVDDMFRFATRCPSPNSLQGLGFSTPDLSANPPGPFCLDCFATPGPSKFHRGLLSVSRMKEETFTHRVF